MVGPEEEVGGAGRVAHDLEVVVAFGGRGSFEKNYRKVSPMIDTYSKPLLPP